MTEILRFLVEHLRFLYESGRYRIVDSAADPGFGGQGLLVLASETLKIRLVRDREFLSLDLGSVEQHGKFDWYAIGVVRRLLAGNHDTDELTAETAAFLEEHLDEIEARFTQPALSGTIEQLKDIERRRAKERFG
jgi:hypothetical protein